MVKHLIGFRPPLNQRMLVVALLFLSLGLSTGCKRNGPPSYISFTYYRSKTYYSNFALACDQIVTNASFQGTNEIRLSGSDTRLPSILRDMNSSYINVSTNRLWMVVDIYAPYGIIWQRDDFKTNLWELEICSEAEPRYVFYLNK